MDSLFYVCTYINSDRTRKLIAKGHNCPFRTDTSFPKDAADVTTPIKTRSMKKNEGEASFKIFINFLLFV